MKYRIVLSYDGKNFQGSQIQPLLRTVQGELEKALKGMLTYYTKTMFASRTDKGVHANFQVASIDIENKIELDKFKIGLNKRLPEDIKVLTVENAADDFHARHSVKMKRYYYTIYKKDMSVFDLNYGLYDKDICIKSLKKMILSFKGKHNFKGFCKEKDEDKDYIKDVDIKIKETKDKIVVYFISRSFLKQMIRILVGSAILVSKNKVLKEDILKNFKTLKRGVATYTAPSKGLFLDYIYY